MAMITGTWKSGSKVSPIATVDEEKLAACFAKLADGRIQQRRVGRPKLRAGRVRAKRFRRETSFMASWSSAGPRASSECQTHEETAAHVEPRDFSLR